MLVQYIRQAITTNGGTPTSWTEIGALRQLVTTYGGTPTQYSVTGLLREAVTAVGGTPTQRETYKLIRELLTATVQMGGIGRPSCWRARLPGLTNREFPSGMPAECNGRNGDGSAFGVESNRRPASLSTGTLHKRCPSQGAPLMGEIVTVNFRGDELYGFKQDDGTFLALKPMVEAMGLNWSGQEQRVKRDPVLSEGICVMHIPFGRGGAQECVCIKLELVNGWLFGIDSARIKDEAVRERVILYQRECYQVLYEHFSGKRKHSAPEIEGDPDETSSVNERRSLVAEARQTFGTQAARELWFEQKLPIVPSMLREGQNDLYPWTMIRHGELDKVA